MHALRFLLLVILAACGSLAQAATYPNPLASGSPVIQAATAFTGSQYITLGQPTALTSVLTPSHEFTILLRKCRAASASTGVWIGQADDTNTTFELLSNGGSAETGIIGGTSFTTGSGSVKNPTWDCLALICHNVSGTFMGSVVLDGGSRSTEVAVGSQVSAKDILIGARRNTSNSDAASFLSGNVGCIAIWNYALTDDQIHSAMGLMNCNEVLNFSYMGTNFGTGLIAYYPCNETSGTTCNDIVAGNNGTATTSVCTTTVFPHYPVQCWGDSLTNGSGSQTGTPYGDQVLTGGSGVRNMRAVQVNGYSGQNVAYIATQQAITANQAFFTWTQLYLVGVHDLGTPSNVTTFLANSIAALPHNRYLVLGLVPYGYGTGSGPSSGVGQEDWGTTGTVSRPNNDAMCLAEQAAYGPRYFALQPVSVAQAVLPAAANDVFQLRTPAPLVASIGPPHLNDSGYVGWSVAIDIGLTSLNPTW